MRLFGLKNCDTCRKALKTLRGAGAHVAYIDVRADGVSHEMLGRFLAAFGDALVNKRSTTWRGLSEGERGEEPLVLLQRYPTLMKRPVIVDENHSYLGWGQDVQSALL